MDQSDDVYLQDEDIGEIFQDEENMAALLLYKQGNSEEYNMVSQVKSAPHYSDGLMQELWVIVLVFNQSQIPP